MITKKLLSTISYNSKEFLVSMFDELLKNHSIAFWCAIHHYGEGGDKDHFHVFIEPNGKVDSTILQDLSCEFIPNYALPLRCVQFKFSKWDDFVWYNIHDPQYLAMKFEVKEYTYSPDEFFTSDIASDELAIRIDQALHSSDVARDLGHITALNEMSAYEMCARGFLRPKEANNFRVFEEMRIKGFAEIRVKERERSVHE